MALVGKEYVTLSLNVISPPHALNACKDASGSHEDSDFGEVGSNVNASNSYVVGNTLGLKRASSNSWPVENLELNKGPLSFDSACRNLHHSKSKRVAAKLKKRKKKNVKDLGRRMEAKPSYFATIAPRSNSSLKRASSSTNNPKATNDSISNNIFSLFIPHRL